MNEVALAKVREDKEREAGQGFDGTWVAHPDLVPVALEIFDRVLGDRPNQLERQRPDVSSSRRRPARRRRDTRRDHDGGPAQQRLGRDPVPRRVAAGLGRGRDLQPDGGRGDLRDLALAGLAVARGTAGSSGRTSSGRSTRRSRSSAGTTRGARAVRAGRARETSSSSSSRCPRTSASTRTSDRRRSAVRPIGSSARPCRQAWSYERRTGSALVRRADRARDAAPEVDRLGALGLPPLRRQAPRVRPRRPASCTATSSRQSPATKNCQSPSAVIAVR